MSKPDNAESCFKCSSCGTMFSRENSKTGRCPKCGNMCSIAKCQIVGASNEDY